MGVPFVADWQPKERLTILLGMLCTFIGGPVDEYNYRETVSPFRSVFTLQPVGYLARSPIVYRAKRGATRTALR